MLICPKYLGNKVTVISIVGSNKHFLFPAWIDEMPSQLPLCIALEERYYYRVTYNPPQYTAMASGVKPQFCREAKRFYDDYSIKTM